MMPYCVEEEEEQWLHPWFRVHAANPPALALCPSLLKLLRLKLLLCSIYDKETTQLLNLRIWPAHFQEIHNSYQIVSRNGPRALLACQYTMIKTCSSLPNGPTATITDALSGDTCMVGWIEAGLHDDICPFSLGRYPRLVLPRTPPEADNTRGSLHVHDDDHVDLDPHDSDMLNAAVDFDDYGNEHDCEDPISDGDINDAYPQDANLTLVVEIYFP
jgi:hypothetical protein